MTTRDHIVREIEQLARVLAEVLLQRQTGDGAAAEQTLIAGAEGALQTEWATLCDLPREAFLERFAVGETTVALADLLRQSAAPPARERARWLYEAALASGDAVPFDVYERIAALR